jgi:Protein of unknown function (DUF2975)
VAAVFKERIDRVVVRGTLLLIVLAGPASIVLTVVAFFRDRSLHWASNSDFGIEVPPFLGEPLPGTSATFQGELTVSIKEPSAGLWWLDALPDLLTAVTMTVVAWILLRLVLDTYGGQPFVAKSARGLRTVALVLGLAAFAVPISTAFANTRILPKVFADSGVTFGSSWEIMSTVTWLLVALLVLAIAEAFRIGSRLAEEVEGLV